MDDVLVRAPTHTRFPTVNVVLFLATVVTTVVSGYAMVADPARGASVLEVIREGLPFAASLMGILFTHEMGHYLMARRYGMDTTLPFFIPFAPWSLGGIGTLGAVIRIRSRMPSRRAVLDIGAAGPIAGFLVALPLLLWGYAHSPVIAGVDVGAQSPLAWLRDWLTGSSGAEHAGTQEVFVFGRSLVSWAALRLTHPGLPAGADVAEHPVAIAAWFGLFVTTLNLVPIGQLDGGHVLYALLGGEKARRISRLLTYGVLALGLFVSASWLVWFVLARFVVGPGHPPATEEEPLGRGRRALAIASLFLFVLTFMPVPVRVGLLP